MALVFYPFAEDATAGSLREKIEQLMEAAERYKAVILESTAKTPGTQEVKHTVPKDIVHSYNWDMVAAVLREIRELPEGSKDDRAIKAEYLTKLSEIYEILRAARMSKLEAVRLALMSEANQLKGGSSASTQVA